MGGRAVFTDYTRVTCLLEPEPHSAIEILNAQAGVDKSPCQSGQLTPDQPCCFRLGFRFGSGTSVVWALNLT